MSGQGASQLLGSQRAVMQPKAVAVLPRGEAIGEDLGQILRRDADAIVTDFNPGELVSVANAQRDFLVPGRFRRRKRRWHCEPG